MGKCLSVPIVHKQVLIAAYTTFAVHSTLCCHPRTCLIQQEQMSVRLLTSAQPMARSLGSIRKTFVAQVTANTGVVGMLEKSKMEIGLRSYAFLRTKPKVSLVLHCLPEFPGAPNVFSIHHCAVLSQVLRSCLCFRPVYYIRFEIIVLTNVFLT